jgi:hypothetical protein
VVPVLRIRLRIYCYTKKSFTKTFTKINLNDFSNSVDRLTYYRLQKGTFVPNVQTFQKCSGKNQNTIFRAYICKNFPRRTHRPSPGYSIHPISPPLKISWIHPWKYSSIMIYKVFFYNFTRNYDQIKGRGKILCLGAPKF